MTDIQKTLIKQQIIEVLAARFCQKRNVDHDNPVLARWVREMIEMGFWEGVRFEETLRMLEVIERRKT